jgi:hypothetical protein
MRYSIAAFCLLLTFCISLNAQPKTPLLRFNSYRVSVEKPRIKKIDFRRNRDAASFRTRLSDGLKAGVNFAGRYMVVTWGCGTGCTNGAIIDTRTGNVLWPEQFFNVSAIYGDGYADPILEDEKNSRLLIIHGSPGTRIDTAKTPPPGDYYYLWKNNGFRRLKFVEKKSSQ